MRSKLLVALTISLVSTLAYAAPALALPKRVVQGPTDDSRHPFAVTVATGVTFAPYVNYPVGSWPESVAVGDFTGDGRSDVATSTSFYFDAPND